MSFRLGLTGSIGMGKSTTAKMFAEAGCAVWDADAAVHRLYGPAGAAVAPIAAVFPTAIQDGMVSRETLKAIISADPDTLKQIEAIVHPLVRADRDSFSAQASADILVFDIPLLFEGRSETEFDAVACVYVDPDTQKARVMARGTMSVDQFHLILSKQMPIDEKRARSDFVIETDTLEHARAQVQDVVNTIKDRIQNA